MDVKKTNEINDEVLGLRDMLDLIARENLEKARKTNVEQLL